jgi:hypothetical protein
MVQNGLAEAHPGCRLSAGLNGRFQARRVSLQGRFRPAQPQHVQTTHQKENARTSRAFVFLSFSSCGIFHYLRQRFFTYLTQFSLSLAPDTTATHLPKSIKGLYLGPSPPYLLRYGFSPPLRGLFLDQKKPDCNSRAWDKGTGKHTAH